MSNNDSITDDEKLDQLLVELSTPLSHLLDLIPSFHRELHLGLSLDDAQMLRALPTFITRLPRGDERGLYLTIDFGGTNVRFGHIVLEGDGNWLLRMEIEKISDIPCSCGDDGIGGGEWLFGYLADKVKVHVEKYGLLKHEGRSTRRSGGKENILPLGFTFSYPVKQLSMNHGVLLQWNKAINCPNVVGQDVVRLLQAALDKRGMSAIQVRALINDTVGTFVAHAYADSRTRCSVVLGTGTNACYLEPVMGIKKLSRRMSTVERLGSSLEVARRYDEEYEGMLINVEWGAFGDTKLGDEGSGDIIEEGVETSVRQGKPKYLKWTRWDEAVDGESANPGKQHFEKMVAGMYIGDICLHIYHELHPEEKLRNEKDGIRTMDSKVCSDIEAGENDLDFRFFEDMQRICRAVSDRSIRLVAAMIMAILTHIRTPSDTVVVAIDGAMYTRYYQYKERLQQAVNEIAAEVEYEVQVLLAEAADQSSVGAAAAIAATQC